MPGPVAHRARQHDRRAPVNHPGPRQPGHPAGALGIIHPFPTILVSGLVAAFATLAGGTPVAIVTLAVAMLGFQASIGATNDLADLPRDREVHAAKPLPCGQATVRAARAVAIVGGAIGLVLSATLGIGVLAVGCAGYACGIGYDLWLRQRDLAWLAYSAAFPLLLVYVWLGAAETPPPAWPALLPMAIAIGPALHLSNSLVDVDTDTSDPSGGLAGHLGRPRAVTVLALLLVVVYAFAWATVMLAGRQEATGMSSLERLAPVGMLAASVAAAAGVWFSGSRIQARRMTGWVVQALATALLGVAWISTVAG